MAGCIRMQGQNSWRIQVSLGKDPTTGRRRRLSRTITGSRQDAEKELRDLLYSIDTGDLSVESRMRLADYLSDWLQHKQTKLAVTTYEWYRSVIENHIVPLLGQIELYKLAPIHIQECYARLYCVDEIPDTKKKVKRLSPNTVKAVHRILRNALEQCRRYGFISENPCDAVDLPKARAEMAKSKCWTPEETAAFLRVASGDRLFALYYLALATGMRRGELLGLYWSDIDFESCLLTVSRVRSKIAGGWVVKEPKTRKSRRSIAISPGALKVLIRYKQMRLKEKTLYSVDTPDTLFVFTKPDGSPVSIDYVSGDYLKTLQDKAGVAPICFHGFRHTHASLLGLYGIPLKAVSRRLGHSSVKITGDIYGHVFEEMDRQAAESFDRIMKIR